MKTLVRAKVPGLLASLILAATVVSMPAQADIITALDALPRVVAGGYAYTYNVSLTGQQQLDPVVNGLPVQFGTVYDFGPTIGSIVTTGYMNQFRFTIEALSTPGNQVLPNDSALLNNVRFTYTGSTAFAITGFTTTNANATFIPAADDNLGTFTVVSPFGPTLNQRIQYDGQARKATNDTVTGNVGYTSGPLVPVPEPASLMLLGLGLGAAGLLRRRAGNRG